MGSKNDNTKKVRTSDLNKKSKSKNGKKVKFKDKHPKAALGIKIGLIVAMLLLIIGAGVLVGAFFGIFGEELKIDESMLKIRHENSTVYDADGNQIAILSGGTKRKSISLSEMSEYLPKAYIAIEDERFYKHSGIDITRTAYATFNYIIHMGKSSFGGSTITQQVIKNITQDKERTAFAGVMRKVKEISKSIQVERVLSKDQILELYLNLIFVGGDDVNGVELGSIYYFDKSAKDLSIAECAYMAGINHSPNAYKPFAEFKDKDDPEAAKQKMSEKIKKRTKTVLGKMKELSYISDDQYNEAVAEVDNGLPFKKGESASVTVDISYVTEAAIEQIIDQILAENENNEDMNRDTAEMYVYSSGLKIYTTQKSNIQSVLEEEIASEKYITTWVDKKHRNDEDKQTPEYFSMPTMTIIDHTTGQVVAAATALGKKDERAAITKMGYFNYPSKDKKQTGSSMKPIAVIAPGLETGKITGATTFFDVKTTWGSGQGAWTPKNYNGYSGSIMNLRNAIRVSANVPHVKALAVIGTENAVEFCESVGLPNFEAEGLNLALGGLQHGVSTMQMASAYGAIANGGKYITPTFYTKVTDNQGNVLYEPKQETKEVMSEQNAYVEKSILTEPVVGGPGPGGNSTASYCAIKGMDVAAKTGTTNDDYDRWLCGFTPYYTAACWYGYKDNHAVVFSGNPAGKIWDAVMTKIHEDLPDAKFEEPEGIIKQAVCSMSGKLPSAGCPTYTEVFTEANVPTTACEGHAGYTICADTQLRATEFCPNQIPGMGYVPEYERGASWATEGAATSMPEGVCPIHTAPAAPAAPAPNPTPAQPTTPEPSTDNSGNAGSGTGENGSGTGSGDNTGGSGTGGNGSGTGSGDNTGGSGTGGNGSGTGSGDNTGGSGTGGSGSGGGDTPANPTE